jgi:hypothetical protein
LAVDVGFDGREIEVGGEPAPRPREELPQGGPALEGHHVKDTARPEVSQQEVLGNIEYRDIHPKPRTRR